MPSEERYSLELNRDEMIALKDTIEYIDSHQQWITSMIYGEDLPAVYAKVYKLGKKAEEAREKDLEENEKEENG